MKSPYERMQNKIDRTDSCWNWTGAILLGYGALGAGARGAGTLSTPTG